MQYIVTFTQYHEYCIDADNEDEAKKKGYEEFERDMYHPVACVTYDECEVEHLNNEEE